jgi:hypothetical protein
LQNLRRIAAQRLNTHYVQQNRDIFAELPEEGWGDVLYQWGTDWMTFGGENRAAVQGYVMRLTDDTPAYLGLLLRHFIDRSFGQQDGGFRYNEFCQLYDPKAILERLDRHGDRSLRSSEEGRAADLFRQQYAASQQPQANPERHEQVD